MTRRRGLMNSSSACCLSVYLGCGDQRPILPFFKVFGGHVRETEGHISPQVLRQDIRYVDVILRSLLATMSAIALALAEYGLYLLVLLVQFVQVCDINVLVVSLQCLSVDIRTAQFTMPCYHLELDCLDSHPVIIIIVQ